MTQVLETIGFLQSLSWNEINCTAARNVYCIHLYSKSRRIYICEIYLVVEWANKLQDPTHQGNGHQRQIFMLSRWIFRFLCFASGVSFGSRSVCVRVSMPLQCCSVKITGYF